jgi:NAD(P)-dependent dehydrogenase (short-subunit alcohol dehydrogenase family)
MNILFFSATVSHRFLILTKAKPILKDMRLKDRVILVTGSYSGIGMAIAKQCVKEGARVVLNGLEEAQGQAVLTAIGVENGICCTQDISAENAASVLIGAAIGRFGKLDAVVNNAAIIQSGNIHTTSLDFIRQMLEVNTIAPLAIIQAALPYLHKTGGCVLNIGSVNAWSGEPNLLPYSISKGALMTLSRNLGDSLFREQGVRVNQINPGWVLTEHEQMKQEQLGGPADWYTKIPKLYSPSGRIFRPEEIAAGAVFLLSGECGPVSGQVLEMEQFPIIGRNVAKDW